MRAKTNTVDSQHAVIEYRDDEECFILQDLNSTHGTFINGCRVQNAAVRLAEQDVIRFGFNTTPFQFINQQQQPQQQQQQQQQQSQFMNMPPINNNGGKLTGLQRATNLQVINQTVPSRATHFAMYAQAQPPATTTSTLIWPNNPNAALITINNSTHSAPPPPPPTVHEFKPPAGLRARPASGVAGGGSCSGGGHFITTSMTATKPSNKWIVGSFNPAGSICSSHSNNNNNNNNNHNNINSNTNRYFPQPPMPIVDSETYRVVAPSYFVHSLYIFGVK